MSGLEPNRPPTRQLVHLFDAELQYRADMPPVVGGDNREGELIGSGDGAVVGERLHGRIRWSMYSADCAYPLVRAGLTPPPGQSLCTVNPGGLIELDDGARAWFEARGYGLRGFDSSQPHLWHLSMALQFTTADECYHWLNATLGLWEDIFDEKIGRAQYSAHGPRRKNDQRL